MGKETDCFSLTNYYGIGTPDVKTSIMFGRIPTYHSLTPWGAQEECVSVDLWMMASVPGRAIGTRLKS